MLIVLIVALSVCLCVLCVACGEKTAEKNKNSQISLDFSLSEGEICYGATGFLYGLAEPDVPSGDLLAGLKPQILSTRCIDGLQHPIGDVAQVAQTFLENGGKQIVLYMQDYYPDWYYAYRDDYDDRVAEMMDALLALDSKDNFIYCPYNEMNNGVWYGDFGVYENRIKFYDAWKNTFNVIKSKSETALIGGPGYTHYQSDFYEEFLVYCINNNCIPNVMIWHELIDYSVTGVKNNYEDYRAVEQKLGIDPLPICVTEYGRMKDNGVPSAMVNYISMFESAKIDACIAFWRLADNLCELAADNNTPSAVWWVYHWYGEMTGNTFATTCRDGFSGLCSYEVDTNKITAIVSGKNSGEVELLNVDSLLGMEGINALHYTLEYVDYQGLGGDCTGSTVAKKGVCSKVNSRFIIKIDDNMVSTRAYRIILTPYDLSADKFSIADKLPQAIYYSEKCPSVRYEAEDALLEKSWLKDRYQINSNKITYASSGDMMVLLDADVALTYNVTAPADGYYRMDIIYSAADTDSDGERINSSAFLTVDGKETLEVRFTNTLKTTAEGKKSVYLSLTMGVHTFTFSKTHGENIADGYPNYDFIDLTYIAETEEEYVFSQNTELTDNGFLCVTPSDGYYVLDFDDAYSGTICLDGNVISVDNGSALYLKKGINFLTAKDASKLVITALNEKCSVLSAKDAYVYDSKIMEDDNSPIGYYISELMGEGYVEFTINVKTSGVYALSIIYSNNEESGVHSYNTKLVERYATMEVNGSIQGRYYFRNTYSWETYSTRTVYNKLKVGDNVIKFYNDGYHIWNDITPYSPRIAGITITSAVKYR